jgi:hypothetical protein
VTAVLALLVAYQLKHFLADFPLQGRYMLGKFRPGWDFIPPLLAHAGVHGAFTLLLSWLAGARPIVCCALAVLDLGVHFGVDRVKASPRLLGRWKPDDRRFWWVLGADQMAHHLTHYAIIWALLA